MKTLPIGLNDFVGQFGRVDWGSTFDGDRNIDPAYTDRVFYS